jgi:hypothetical protein
MTATFHIVCHETRQTLWIGQGHGEADTVRALGQFLIVTKGKPLVVMSEHEIDARDDMESYEDFRDAEPRQT